MNKMKTQSRNRIIVGGAIVFGVFAVYACLLLCLNRGEPISAFIVTYLLMAVSGAITAAVGGVLYWKVSGKVEKPEKEKPEKMQKPEKVKAEVAEKKPVEVKAQKPKKSLKERFEGWLGSLRKKKAGEKVEEAKATKKETVQPIWAEELAQVEEAFQPEIQEPTDDFFDNVISEKGAGTEEVVGLDKEARGAVEAAEIAKVPDKENKESKDKDFADDDFIELKPVDEAFDDKEK